jgi:hypothetical protein
MMCVSVQSCGRKGGWLTYIPPQPCYRLESFANKQTAEILLYCLPFKQTIGTKENRNTLCFWLKYEKALNKQSDYLGLLVTQNKDQLRCPYGRKYTMKKV